MTDYNYSISDIQRIISNINECISYYEKEREKASTRPEKEYWDGYASGLKRAQYFMIILRNKKWYPPRKIIEKYSETDCIYIDTDSIKVKENKQ